jgi:hypothetical protein
MDGTALSLRLNLCDRFFQRNSRDQEIRLAKRSSSLTIESAPCTFIQHAARIASVAVQPTYSLGHDGIKISHWSSTLNIRTELCTALLISNYRQSKARRSSVRHGTSIVRPFWWLAYRQTSRPGQRNPDFASRSACGPTRMKERQIGLQRRVSQRIVGLLGHAV